MQVLSKTQAHEVVVPWQHEVVHEEAETSDGEGKGEEPVDVEGGGNSGTVHGYFSYSVMWRVLAIMK